MYNFENLKSQSNAIIIFKTLPEIRITYTKFWFTEIYENKFVAISKFNGEKICVLKKLNYYYYSNRLEGGGEFFTQLLEIV